MYPHVVMEDLTKLGYRVGHDFDTTIKILREVFGYHVVESQDVREWFHRFPNANVVKLRNFGAYESELAKIFPNGTSEFLKGMLSQVRPFAKKCVGPEATMNVSNGRIAYGTYEDEFVVVDIFHGKHRSIPFEFGTHLLTSVQFIDEERFLVFEYKNAILHLYVFCFDEFTLEHLDSVQLDLRFEFGRLILDGSDFTKFAVYLSNNDVFCAGKVVEDRIMLGEVSQSGISMVCPCLNGPKLQFISSVGSSSCKLCEFNLESRALTSFNIETKFGDGETFDLLKNAPWAPCSYFVWVGSWLYVVHEPKMGLWKVVALNAETREWFDTRVKVHGNLCVLYADDSMHLTAVTVDGSWVYSFYRFALTKPDSLVNLAWFSYTDTFKKTGERGNLFKKLPYNCDLRLELPDVDQESDEGESESEKSEGESNERGESESIESENVSESGVS